MRDTEGRIHRSILHWLRAVLPGAIIHHSPNSVRWGGKAAQINGAKNVAMGTLAGFPDIFCRTYSGDFYFEVKAEGSYLSPAQKAFRDQLAALGCHRYAVVRSIEDAREALDSWGITTRETRE